MKNDNQVPGFRSMPRPQKAAVLTLSALGLAIIGFWFWQFSSHIKSPFTIIEPSKNSSLANRTIDLHNIDSDSDGLSDYDEINTYRTSPYLEDSDSDGLSDQKEVQKGSDPNCPEGQNCSLPAAVVSSSPASQAGIGTDLEIDTEITSTSTLENMMKGQLDAASLRALLIENGADKAILDQISDEDLMASYRNTLESQNTNNNQ